MKRFLYILTIIILLTTSSISTLLALKYKYLNDKLQVENNNLISEKTDLQKSSDNANNKPVTSLNNYIDIKVQECMSGCNYTTACMSNCVYWSEDMWEEEIDKNINLLKAKMTKDEIDLLKISQSQWKEYKNAQQILNAKVLSAKVGTMYTNVLAAEQVAIVERRANELDGLYYFYSLK